MVPLVSSQKSSNQNICALILFFVIFVAFSEYVNFSLVLQNFHRLVSFENVDAIDTNCIYIFKRNHSMELLQYKNKGHILWEDYKIFKNNPTQTFLPPIYFL